MSSRMYAKYWPFRSRSRAAAPRGRLEEESEDISVRGGVNKKKLRESPGAVTDEARAADAAARKKERDVRTPAQQPQSKKIAAPTPVSPKKRARDAARGSVAGLAVSMERLDVAEEAETPRSRRGSLDSESSDSATSSRSTPPSSPSFTPAQPGRALQETPVFAAKAVMIKREKSGEFHMKRSNSLLSRSIGRDGRESPNLRREHSWCSDSDASPCPSPVSSPMHAALAFSRVRE